MPIKNWPVTQPGYYIKVFIATIGLEFCFSNVSAQLPDYFITLKNDTVRCKLKQDYFTDSLWYKLTEHSPYKPLSYDTLTEYYCHLAKRPVTRRTIADGSITFVKWLMRGKINLYETEIEKRHSLLVTYYASKDNNPLIEIGSDGGSVLTDGQTKKQILAFSALIADVPECLKQYKRDYNFDYKGIKVSIKKYNAYQAQKK